MTPDALIADVLKREAGFVNHASDRGGPTNFGITLATARAHGFMGSMQSLPLATAKAIYFQDYWSAPLLGEVAKLAPNVAAEMFDTGVNCGTAVAAMMLQRALNVLQGTNLAIDGKLSLGGATLSVLRSYMATRGGQGGERVLLRLLDGLQVDRYVSLVERDGSQRAFLFGWINNRVGNVT